MTAVLAGVSHFIAVVIWVLVSLAFHLAAGVPECLFAHLHAYLSGLVDRSAPCDSKLPLYGCDVQILMTYCGIDTEDIL